MTAEEILEALRETIDPYFADYLAQSEDPPSETTEPEEFEEFEEKQAEYLNAQLCMSALEYELEQYKKSPSMPTAFNLLMTTAATVKLLENEPEFEGVEFTPDPTVLDPDMSIVAALTAADLATHEVTDVAALIGDQDPGDKAQVETAPVTAVTSLYATNSFMKNSADAVKTLPNVVELREAAAELSPGLQF